MRTKTDIGQVFLTHPRDENFTTLFTEAFSKQGDTVELFAVVEIENTSRPGELRLLRAECEKLAGAMVGALKKSYITAAVIDQHSFEKALASVNAAISRTLRMNRANWFTNLNVGLAALYKNELSLSVAGNALVLLLRGQETTVLSEGLSETPVRPAKIFSNYSCGALANGDRVALTTKQLLNYLSMERVREHLLEETVSDICREMINAVADTKTAGFATFVFEVGGAGRAQKNAAGDGALPAYRPSATVRRGDSKSWVRIAFFIGLNVLEALWRLVRRARKKWLFVAVGALLLILLGNIAAGLVRKYLRQNEALRQESQQQIEKTIAEAEAALIYNDEKTAAEGINEAEKWFAANPLGTGNQDTKRQELETRLQQLKNKVSKIIRIESPIVLTTFPLVPTDILPSGNGVVAANRDSGRLAYYDFRSGETRALLADQNLSRLAAGAHVGGDIGYIFYGRDGIFSRLDLSNNSLTPYETAGPAAGGAKMVALGSGAAARLYLLDRSQNQIWRVKITSTGVAAPEAWLKAAENLSGVTDLAVDGAIYLLKEASAEKFFNGARQSFALSPVVPPLQNAAAIFTNADLPNIYVLEPQQERILVFDKTGKLAKQLVSPKFRDAADLYADETGKLIYVIAGSELLQMTMP